MNTEKTERPYVTIDLKPIYQDFLYHEFGQEEKEDGVVVSCSHEIGKMIMAMVTITDKPRKQELGEHPINIYVPTTPWSHALFRENFIYIPEWKQKQIRMYIESLFRIKVKEYFLIGHEKGYRQDHIIESFMRAYNIKHCALNFSQLKKMDYRNRRKITDQIAADIAAAIPK